MTLLLKSIEYATGAPYFWGSMGFTAAIAVFVGAAIYDGHLNQVKKALISVLSYAGMVVWVTSSRIANTLSISGKEPNPERPLGSIVALICVTASWVLGVLIGVLIFRYKYKDKYK